MMRLLITLAALALATLPATAQVTPLTPGSVRGFSLNASLGLGGLTDEEAGGFTSDEDQTYGGGGIALGLAYGFNETAELFLDLSGYGLDVDDIETAGIAHLDLGGRFYFRRAAAKLRPFALGALTARSYVLEDDDETLTYTGGAVTYGGGVRYFFSGGWAFNAQIVTSFGEFTDAEFESDFGDDEADDLHLDATSGRLQLGIVWYPGR